MDEIKNPHDRFFKEIFSSYDRMEEFLENYLPPNIAQLVDLKSLEYTKDTFIDGHLKEYFSDLLCKAYFKNGSWGCVYILFEHKSYQEHSTAFYLLRYMVKIWEKWPNDEKGVFGFPVIIPIILYHGKGAWKVGLRYRDLFHYPEEVASCIPDFQYILWDASRYSDEEIKGKVMLRVALLTMKYIFREDLQEHLPDILKLLRSLAGKRTGIEYIETILRYIIHASPKGTITYGNLMEAIENALPDKGGEIMPTLADELREQGIQQGLQQGLQQGAIQNAKEAVIDNLAVRFEAVPEPIIKAIHEINELALLKILHRKSIKVKSLEEFVEVIKVMTS